MITKMNSETKKNFQEVDQKHVCLPDCLLCVGGMNGNEAFVRLLQGFMIPQE